MILSLTKKLTTNKLPFVKKLTYNKFIHIYDTYIKNYINNNFLLIKNLKLLH